MKKQVYHEGHNYVLEYDNNSLIMYKEDIDEWMGDIEYIKVFTVEGDTPRPIQLYRKLVVAANKLIAQVNSDWFMFSVTDQKRADLYERFTRSIKGYSCQRLTSISTYIEIRMARSEDKFCSKICGDREWLQHKLTKQ